MITDLRSVNGVYVWAAHRDHSHPQRRRPYLHIGDHELIAARIGPLAGDLPIPGLCAHPRLPFGRQAGSPKPRTIRCLPCWHQYSSYCSPGSRPRSATEYRPRRGGLAVCTSWSGLREQGKLANKPAGVHIEARAVPCESLFRDGGSRVPLPAPPAAARARSQGCQRAARIRCEPPR